MFKGCLYQALYNKDRWARSNSAYILGKMKGLDAIDSLQLAYKQKRIRARSMIGAFEDIGDSVVVPIIIPYLKDKEEPTRIASARALAKIKDVRAIPSLYQALSDKFFTVRIAAETALFAIGDSSLKYLLTKPKDPRIIGVIASLGAKLDTVDNKTERIEIEQVIVPFLDNPQAGIRLKAVNALGLFNDQTLKPLLQTKMESEKDEFVLDKYKEVLK
jgi:HEAT repeat protein